MDLDRLADSFVTTSRFPARSHRIRGLVLCSPHNPVGRVWSEDELSQLAEICLENNCALISDEIHCDLLVGNVGHTVTSTLSAEVEHNTMTLMSPSKTFNLAGMCASFAIIPNPEWRTRFSLARTGQSGVNIMGLVAMEAALRHGDSYLEQLNEYLRENVEYFAGRINAIPGLKLVRPEGTYLAWVDMGDLGMDDEQLRDFMLHRARIATDFGFVFGPGGEGFQRFNLACPRSIVVEATGRLERAVADLTG
jgi:cysteine-S-conjugate beta-lyase